MGVRDVRLVGRSQASVQCAQMAPQRTHPYIQPSKTLLSTQTDRHTEKGEEDVGDGVDGVEQVEVQLEGGGRPSVLVVEEVVVLEGRVEGRRRVWFWVGGV